MTLSDQVDSIFQVQINNKSTNSNSPHKILPILFCLWKCLHEISFSLKSEIVFEMKHRCVLDARVFTRLTTQSYSKIYENVHLYLPSYCLQQTAWILNMHTKAFSITKCSAFMYPFDGCICLVSVYIQTKSYTEGNTQVKCI